MFKYQIQIVLSGFDEWNFLHSRNSNYLIMSYFFIFKKEDVLCTSNVQIILKRKKKWKNKF